MEQVKREGLDVDLERLEADGYDSLTPEEWYRLKTWGVCSQRTPGLHMLRIRVPGGQIEAGQLRGLAALSEEFADGSAHITLRQNLEFHGVPSRKIRKTLEGIGRLGLSTRSACGHTVRNIVGCSLAGICAEEVLDVRPTVQAIHDFFLTRAAFYNSRLPRRLNIYVSGCPQCMAHAQIQDLGFVATRRGADVGFQLWCAGSLASNPRLAHLLFGFVPVEEVLAVCEAVGHVYIEHGFRSRPAKARLKFLLEDWGEDRFAEAILDRLREKRPGTRTERAGALPILGADRRRGSHHGVHPQRQAGYVRVETRVPLGDLSQDQMHALVDVAESYADGHVYLTREQNAELHWVRYDAAEAVGTALEKVGLLTAGAGSLVDVSVCAGTEWCVWGIGDSRGMARELTEDLAKLAASDRAVAPLRVAVSGCFHGCASHQAADVGLSAVRSSDGADSDEGFEIYGGGHLGPDPVAGQRIGRVALPDTRQAVVELFRTYLQDRASGESFPAYMEREGRNLLARLRAAEPVS